MAHPLLAYAPYMAATFLASKAFPSFFSQLSPVAMLSSLRGMAGGDPIEMRRQADCPMSRMHCEPDPYDRSAPYKRADPMTRNMERMRRHRRWA